MANRLLCELFICEKYKMSTVIVILGCTNVHNQEAISKVFLPIGDDILTANNLNCFDQVEWIGNKKRYLFI